MKRPMLVSGITMITVSALLMNLSKVGAIAMLLIGALAFVLFLIKPLKLRRFVIIPALSLATIFICTSFLTYTHFKIEPLLKYDGNTSYISGKVITTPVNNNGYLNLTLKTDENIKIDVTLPYQDEVNPKLYDYISIDNAQLSVTRNDNYQFDLSRASDGILLNAKGASCEILWECEKTPYYYCLYFREIVSNRINDFLLPPSSGILNGLIFGGSKDVPDNIADAFRNGGISHLLAVSGLHTSLWCGLILFLLKLFKIPKKIRNIFCIIFLVGFCTVTGFTPSVLRSSLMSLVLLTSPFAKSEPDSLNSLGFATTILLLSNPYIIFSLSFQLSLCATLGVLLVSRYELKVHRFFSKIKFKPLGSFLNYTVCSFMLSAGAGLFTMPVSALNFNVLSVVSPVTNILCVKPAFYAMICGTLGIATSYIEVSFIKKISIFLFDVTDLLLNLVSEISFKISDFTYCTIPVHKNWLLNGLVLGAVIAGIGYIIYRIKNKKTLIATVIITVAVIFINIFIPLLPTPYHNTLTVVSSGNNLNVIVRSGTHYAYIINSESKYPYAVYNYLPKATCESLDYWFVTYVSYESCIDLERMNNVIHPKETYITPTIRKICINENIELPQNTIISTQGIYTLNNEINFEIIDTYRTKYVIIKSNEKTVYIHLYGNPDLSEVVDTNDGDIFIYNSEIPEEIPPSAKEIIISGESDFIINSDYNKHLDQGENLHLTAKDGDIKINL